MAAPSDSACWAAIAATRRRPSSQSSVPVPISSTRSAGPLVAKVELVERALPSKSLVKPGGSFTPAGTEGLEPSATQRTRSGVLPSLPAVVVVMRMWDGVPTYMSTYLGPPPPSGTTHSMFSYGSMMSHVLQWTQLLALITTSGVPSGHS